MHYDRYAFAINSSQPTTVPLQATNATIGQRVKMSPIDILEVQRYYGCVPTASTTTTTAGAASTTTGATSTTAGSSSTTAGTSSITVGPTSTTAGPTSTTAGAASTTAGAASTTAPSTAASNNTTPNGDHMVADTAETFFVSYLMIYVSIFIHLIE